MVVKNTVSDAIKHNDKQKWRKIFSRNHASWNDLPLTSTRIGYL